MFNSSFNSIADNFSKLTDCTYDTTTSHVEYICDSKTGVHFHRRNLKFLYCNNYPYGINRENVSILSFHGCRDSGIDDKFKIFKSLHTFNVSTWGIRHMNSKTLSNFNYLENFIASHNNIENISPDFFMHTPELMEIDLSYNNIRLLEYNLLISNEKLMSLNLRNNPLMRISCEFLMTLNSHLLTISFNTLDTLKTNCLNEKAHINSSVTISSDKSTTTALKICNGQFEWIFTEADFNHIYRLDFSNSDMKNISALLEAANPQTSELNLSNRFVGKLNEKTFQKFKSLKFLYLS